MSDEGIERMFRVTHQEQNHFWMELLEGVKKHTDFVVVVEPGVVSEIEVGDEILATICSHNGNNTKWELLDYSSGR